MCFEPHDTILEGIGGNMTPHRGFNAVKTQKLFLVMVWDRRYGMTRERNFEQLCHVANFFEYEGW